MSILDTIKNFGNLGGFGELIFTVNPFKQLNFQNAQHSSSVKFVDHEIIAGTPKLEFVGYNLDTVKLTIKLSSYFGVSPKKTLDILYEYMESGDVYDLILGCDVLGEFVIDGIDKTYDKVDSFGNLTEVGVSLSFKEYN